MNLYLLTFVTKPSRNNTTVVLVQDINMSDRMKLSKTFEDKFPKLKVSKTYQTFDFCLIKNDLNDLRDLAQIVYNLERFIMRRTLESHMVTEEIQELEVYKREFDRKSNEMVDKIVEIRGQPTHASIIQFCTKRDTKLFMKALTSNNLDLLNYLSNGRKRSLKTDEWTVSYAPDPLDLDWKILVKDWKNVKLKHLFIFTLLTILCGCLTTPLIFIGRLEMMWNVHFSPFLQFLSRDGSTYMMTFLAWGMPYLIVWITSKIPTNFVSEKMINIENFSLGFNIFIIVIFPSLGLYS